jgi:signal transduction histidine kinase
MNLGREDEPEASFDLVEGVARTVMLCQASGRLRRLRLTSDLGDAPVFVWGRASDADQIVLNLLGNAIDAVDGRVGAQVRLSIRVGEGRCRLEVADNGPGLAPAAKDRLFEPYLTTKPAGAGTGLGLAVSRRLAEHMGGAIGLGDRPEGGALAWVELPTRRLTNE